MAQGLRNVWREELLLLPWITIQVVLHASSVCPVACLYYLVWSQAKQRLDMLLHSGDMFKAVDAADFNTDILGRAQQVVPWVRVCLLADDSARIWAS